MPKLSFLCMVIYTCKRQKKIKGVIVNITLRHLVALLVLHSSHSQLWSIEDTTINGDNEATCMKQF